MTITCCIKGLPSNESTVGIVRFMQFQVVFSRVETIQKLRNGTTKHKDFKILLFFDVTNYTRLTLTPSCTL
jgi:hypothetical protein